MKNTELNETILKFMNRTNKEHEDMVAQLIGSVQEVANILTYEQLNTDEFDYLVESAGIMYSLHMKNNQLVEAINKQFGIV